MRLELKVDVTAAAGLDEPAHISMTIDLPDVRMLGSNPVVCFAKPGGGFSRGYYTQQLPGADVSQAEWHARRGWIFVSVDHLGVGESSIHSDANRLDYTTVSAAGHAAEKEVLERLARAELHPSLPIIESPIVLGLGQSMGGSLTVVQQGRYRTYDGIGVLGFSAVHTHPAIAGMDPVVVPWFLRDPLPPSTPAILNGVSPSAVARDKMAAINRKLFYYDDLDGSLVDTLMHSAANPSRPAWISTTYPLGVVSRCLTPGVIAQEAAAITVPVLVALGERDVIADPKGEPRAYLSATSVDLFICPRMGHMHNFATTRELFWQRLDNWANWVVEVKNAAHQSE